MVRELAFKRAEGNKFGIPYETIESQGAALEKTIEPMRASYMGRNYQYGPGLCQHNCEDMIVGATLDPTVGNSYAAAGARNTYVRKERSQSEVSQSDCNTLMNQREMLVEDEVYSKLKMLPPANAAHERAKYNLEHRGEASSSSNSSSSKRVNKNNSIDFTKDRTILGYTCIIKKIMEQSPEVQVSRRQKSKPLTFEPSSVTLPVWLDAIMHNQYFSMPRSVLVNSLIYLKRFLQIYKGQVFLTQNNLHRLTLTSLIIASKMSMEWSPSHTLWTKIVNNAYQSSVLSDLETQFLIGLDMETYVAEDEFREISEEMYLLGKKEGGINLMGH